MDIHAPYGTVLTGGRIRGPSRMPGRFGRRARSSRPGRANGQSSSAALRTCAPAVRTPAVRVVHANPGHLASSRGEPRLASPARAPAATALPVGPETCSAGPERRGRCAPRRRAGRPPAAVRLAVGVAGTRSPSEAASWLWNGAERARSGGSCRRSRRGRTRPTRTRGETHPRMPATPRFLCSLRFVCTLGGHRRSHTPAGAPDRSHDAFCRARCPPRAPPRQVHPHARARTRAHTPHGPPGRPPPSPVTFPPSFKRRCMPATPARAGSARPARTRGVLPAQRRTGMRQRPCRWALGMAVAVTRVVLVACAAMLAPVEQQQPQGRRGKRRPQRPRGGRRRAGELRG